ncbi:hypothetical protein QE152_g7090 [Popillia japonica]|uniref:Uncharacterized protein n=1 Tax=Popillia japonica TaxID=7064 RepID=A0AAW1MGD1_POPJA
MRNSSFEIRESGPRSQGSSDDRDAIAPITNRPHFDPLVDPHLLTYEVERWENRFKFETRPLRVPIDPCAEALKEERPGIYLRTKLKGGRIASSSRRVRFEYQSTRVRRL